MRPDPVISALIITRGREPLLRDCLAALRAAGPAEVIVGVNGEDPASLRAAADFPGTRAVALPRMCRGEARNALAALASGRWLCFLDDDTVPPPGYFDRLAALIAADPGAAVFGGGQLPSPRAGAFETAAYWTLASRWGSGPFAERFRAAEGTRRAGPEKFILCNLALDREFLRREGLAFEGHLTSAEENLLLNRMAAAGAAMALSGDLNLVHRRRAAPGAFLRQTFSCARGRAQITLLSRRGFHPFTLLPACGLLAAAALAVLRPGWLAAAVCGYAACCAAAAALSGAPARLKPGVAALFPAVHLAYAAGLLWGAGEAAADKVFSAGRPARCSCEGNP